MAVVFVPGGDRSMICTADCNSPGHGRCIKTKTMKAPARLTDRNRGQGRPVGYLAAWLAKGVTCGTKAEHWSADNEPNLDERVAARESLKADESPDAALLLTGEAPVGDGPEEPVRVP